MSFDRFNVDFGPMVLCGHYNSYQAARIASIHFVLEIVMGLREVRLEPQDAHLLVAL